MEDLKNRIDTLEFENSVMRNRIKDLEKENVKLTNKIDILEYETKRGLEVVSNFQEHTVEYLHYLENKINNIHDVKPILIINNDKKA